jgi:ATP-dependent Clp protease ATP-binding subunit ClpC
VFNILLQVFEDGQLTDGLGNTVDFKNTIIIMTSNIGARHLQKREGLGFQSTKEDAIAEKVEELVKNEVKRTFNPEFLNRLDEIEKAHPDLFNILLQVFEDGHLTDGLGNRVNFKNTIIIMTSNIGARFIQKKSSMGFQSSETAAIDKSVNDMVLGEVKRTFNPEFINRIDEIIVFEALSDDDLRRILGLLVAQLNTNLADRRLKITMTSEVADWIIEATCKDRSYGARPLRRAIQRYIEDPLSEELIRGHLGSGGDIEVYLEGGALAYRPVGQAETGRRLA